METFNLELARDKIKELGYIPLFNEYKNINSKVLVSTKEGYKLYLNFYSLLRSKTSRIFDINNIYTIENIKLWLKLNCANLQLLSTEYKGVHCKLDFIDNEGYKLSGTLHNLQDRKALNYFDVSNKFTIENIKLWLSFNRPDYELLSTKYEGNGEYLKLLCKKHGEFKLKWKNLKGGNRCKKCAIEDYTGEHSPFWKDGISALSDYFRSKMKPWKQKSIKKYNYKCDITGTHDNLVIHHHYNFSDILQEAIKGIDLPIYNEINKYTSEELKKIEKLCLELHYKHGLGICLSKKEHDYFHNIYGVKHNTMQQYKKFKKMRLKQLNENQVKAS